MKMNNVCSSGVKLLLKLPMSLFMYLGKGENSNFVNFDYCVQFIVMHVKIQKYTISH